jgi:hypothetical protein
MPERTNGWASVPELLTREMIPVPTMLIRGGTSKGVFLRPSDLPEDRTLWGPYLIDLFGARDVRQIDGLGGAMPTTSKCCIVGPSGHPEADVDYTFAQVAIGEERVFWDFNCGNLTPSVGTFAILAGMVPAKPGLTTVRVYQTNTKMLLTIEVPTDDDGAPLVEGDYVNAGVTGTGAAVWTDFSRATGASLGGDLFPTGHRADVLDVPGIGKVTATIVDLANMCVFFRAGEAGLTGYEMPEQGPDVVDTFTAVRHAAQDLLGVDHAKTTPWPITVAPPKAYETYGGKGTLAAADYDFAVRFAGIQPMRDTLHEAHPGTASCGTAIAAVTRGTVVHELYAARPRGDDNVTFGHPSGTITVEARVHYEGDRPVADRAVLGRTVRPIMAGTALVRRAEVDRLTSAIDRSDRTRSTVPEPGRA